VNIRRDIELFEKFTPKVKAERDQRIHEIDERINKIEGKSSDMEEIIKSPKWPWGLLGIASAIVFFILIPVSMQWIMNLQSTENSENNWVRDSIQQGTESWALDPNDPMVEQRIILINTWINELTTQKAITLINYFNEEDNETPITIYLSSTGGYTKDAIAIVNAIQESNVFVNTTAIGDCFSACAMILTSGTGERLVAANSLIAIHTHSYPVNTDPYSENTTRYQREIEFFQTYSNIPSDWINRDEKLYYLTTEQALTFKVVDGILE
jgi:ATP-dependent protease ClpP protease subunit